MLPSYCCGHVITTLARRLPNEESDSEEAKSQLTMFCKWYRPNKKHIKIDTQALLLDIAPPPDEANWPDIKACLGAVEEEADRQVRTDLYHVHAYRKKANTKIM